MGPMLAQWTLLLGNINFDFEGRGQGDQPMGGRVVLVGFLYHWTCWMISASYILTLQWWHRYRQIIYRKSTLSNKALHSLHYNHIRVSNETGSSYITTTSAHDMFWLKPLWFSFNCGKGNIYLNCNIYTQFSSASSCQPNSMFRRWRHKGRCYVCTCTGYHCAQRYHNIWNW